MKAVHDLTGFNFEECYRLPVLEFFLYLQYSNYRVARKQREIDKMNKRKRFG